MFRAKSALVRGISVVLAVGLPFQSTAVLASESPRGVIWRNPPPEKQPDNARLDLGCFAPEVIYAGSPQVDSPTGTPRDADTARLAAEQDGRRDVSGTTWFVLGCLFPLPAVIAAYVHDPDPPASRLVGKSPEYTGVYTDSWRRQSKSKRTKNAWIGAAVGFSVAVILLSAASASEY